MSPGRVCISIPGAMWSLAGNGVCQYCFNIFPGVRTASPPCNVRCRSEDFCRWIFRQFLYAEGLFTNKPWRKGQQHSFKSHSCNFSLSLTMRTCRETVTDILKHVIDHYNTQINNKSNYIMTMLFQTIDINKAALGYRNKLFIHIWTYKYIVDNKCACIIPCIIIN